MGFNPAGGDAGRRFRPAPVSGILCGGGTVPKDESEGIPLDGGRLVLRVVERVVICRRQQLHAVQGRVGAGRHGDLDDRRARSPLEHEDRRVPVQL